MPETRVVVRWPDGAEATLWSPSTVIAQHLEAGCAYPMAEFLRRIRAGLHAASERVRERHGRPCALAARELAAIEARAADFSWAPDAAVACLSVVSEGSAA